MDKLKWEFLTETNSRAETDMLKSYLEAEGISVEAFQESIGVNNYPTSFASAKLFVPKPFAAEARRLLEQFRRSEEKQQ